MKRYTKLFFLLLAGALIFQSCEDPIDLDLDDGRSQFIVDAFITNESVPQTVRLSQTIPYFQNENTPAVTGATVRMDGSDGSSYIFSEQSDGNYVWTPAAGEAIDTVGVDYQLTVDINGKVFLAYSQSNPVPPIDTIEYEFREAEVGQEEGYYASYFATDIFGRQDYYWTKYYVNGELMNSPEDIILSIDAAFGSDGTDGFLFIIPIREAINDFDDPYELGDSVTVELHAIDGGAYEFLQEVFTQTNNDGLFALPPANVRTNILDANGNSQEDAVGYFSVSQISRRGVKIQ